MTPQEADNNVSLDVSHNNAPPEQIQANAAQNSQQNRNEEQNEDVFDDDDVFNDVDDVPDFSRTQSASQQDVVPLSGSSLARVIYKL